MGPGPLGLAGGMGRGRGVPFGAAARDGPCKGWVRMRMGGGPCSVRLPLLFLRMHHRFGGSPVVPTGAGCSPWPVLGVGGILLLGRWAGASRISSLCSNALGRDWPTVASSPRGPSSLRANPRRHLALLQPLAGATS